MSARYIVAILPQLNSFEMSCKDSVMKTCVSVATLTLQVVKNITTCNNLRT